MDTTTFNDRPQVDHFVPSAPYRTVPMWWHQLRGKPSHLKATAEYPYPCHMILSHHRPRRAMAYSGLWSGAEYDVLDYNVPIEAEANAR